MYAFTNMYFTLLFNIYCKPDKVAVIMKPTKLTTCRNSGTCNSCFTPPVDGLIYYKLLKKFEGK